MATGVFFHAHPDDEAIASGGTMAKAKADGHRVVLVVATRGELGTPVPGVLDDGEALPQRRVLETYRSAEILGVDRVEFLGYHDSGMMGDDTNDDPACFWRADIDQAADRLAAVLRDVDADLLVVYDDHGGYGHPDHIQVHRVGVEAAARAGTPRVFESTMNRDQLRRGMVNDAAAQEASANERDPDVPDLDDESFGSSEDLITHAVDVRAFLQHKRAAMMAHASQIAETSFFLSMAPAMFTHAFGTEWYIERGAPRGSAPFAEALFDGAVRSDEVHD